MITRKLLYGTAGAVLVAAAALADASPASAACKGHPHEGRARGLLQTTTEIAARSNWRSEVRRHDGYRFARWTLARDKNMRCRKLKPGRHWHCVARAIPCNSR